MCLSILNKDFSTRDYQFIFSCISSAAFIAGRARPCHCQYQSLVYEIDCKFGFHYNFCGVVQKGKVWRFLSYVLIS